MKKLTLLFLVCLMGLTAFGQVAVRSLNGNATNLTAWGDLLLSDGTIIGNDAGLITSVLSPIIQSSIPTNQIYEAFPVLGKTVDNKRIYVSYSSATNHLSNGGVLRHAVSTNAGLSWNQLPVVSEPGTNIANHAFGVTSRGRLVLLHQRREIGGAYHPPVSKVSDDGGLTWTTTTTIATNNSVSGTGFAPFGKIRERNGVLYAGYYIATSSAANVWEIYMLTSSDWGETWTRSLIDGATSGMSEPDVFPFYGSNALIAVARRESNDLFLRSYLSTNGVDWTATVLPFSKSATSARDPVSMELIEGVNGPELVLVQGYRAQTNLVASSWPLGELSLSTNKVGNYQRLAPISINNPKDGGYGSTLTIGGEILVAYYYASGTILPTDASTFAEIRFARFAPQATAEKLTIWPRNALDVPFSVMDESGNPVFEVKKGAVWMSLFNDRTANNIARLAYPAGGAMNLNNENFSAQQGASITLSATNYNVFGNPGGITLATESLIGQGQIRFLNQNQTNASMFAGTNRFYANATSHLPLEVVNPAGQSIVTVTNNGAVWGLLLNDRTANNLSRYMYPLGGGLNMGAANSSISGGPSMNLSGIGMSAFGNAGGIDYQAANGGGLRFMTWNGTTTHTNIHATFQTTRINSPAGLILTTAAAPATAGSAGTAGEIRIDSNFIYFCNPANTWTRAALSTW